MNTSVNLSVLPYAFAYFQYHTKNKNLSGLWNHVNCYCFIVASSYPLEYFYISICDII